jgi:hypothetical protein
MRKGRAEFDGKHHDRTQFVESFWQLERGPGRWSREWLREIVIGKGGELLPGLIRRS